MINLIAALAMNAGAVAIEVPDPRVANNMHANAYSALMTAEILCGKRYKKETYERLISDVVLDTGLKKNTILLSINRMIGKALVVVRANPASGQKFCEGINRIRVPGEVE